ncbi:MAG: McrC family protein [Prolixibacteraceae bacterium]
MAEFKQICEFGTIWNAKDFDHPLDDFNTVYLDAHSFDSLKGFVAENNDPGTEIEAAFSYHRKKGKDFIRVKNYVGVIETRQGTSIEILPKIYTGNSDDQKKSIIESRLVLLSMLRCLKDSPFKTIDQAHLNSTRMPILEIFIALFLKEMDNIVKRGIKHFYTNIEENQKFLKGRLIFSQHIKQNITRADRFYVRFDEFKADIPQNRILKTALNYLSNKTRSTKNKRQINDLLGLLDEVAESTRLADDLNRINGHNRLFSYYDNALKWAKLFLEGKTFTSYKGNHLNTALLFPMEVLFESYVAHKMKIQYPEYNITTQDRKHYLLTDVQLKRQKFRIRPDLVIETPTELIIADTKWKIIDQNQSSKNYLISQADMYQLYAYGKKYESKQLILIYPECETFTEPLHFEYDGAIDLRCEPWRFGGSENRIIHDVIKTGIGVS